MIHRRANPSDDVEFAPTFRRDEVGSEVAEIAAYLGGKYAGVLVLTRMDDEDVDRACMRNVDRFRRDHEEPFGILVVSNVRVEPSMRGKGIGAALYTEAVYIARRRFGAVILSHECVGGQTSGDAARVWDSARFRGRAEVRGQVAVWPTPLPPIANPSRKRKPSR